MILVILVVLIVFDNVLVGFDSVFNNIFDIVFVVWRYGSQLFRHRFFFCDLPFRAFFYLVVRHKQVVSAPVRTIFLERKRKKKEKENE